jgi:hypothetical protein
MQSTSFVRKKIKCLRSPKKSHPTQQEYVFVQTTCLKHSANKTICLEHSANKSDISLNLQRISLEFYFVAILNSVAGTVCDGFPYILEMMLVRGFPEGTSFPRVVLPVPYQQLVQAPPE